MDKKKRGTFSNEIFPGAKFHHLEVVERLGKNYRGDYLILCHCVCGKCSTPTANNLLSGNSKSCGCQKHSGMKAHSDAKKGTGAYGTVVPGAKFGRLTVIERLKEGSSLSLKVRCRCRCGTVKDVWIDSLLSESTRSCGCLSRETTAKRNKESGKYGSFSAKHPKTWQSWCSMMSRCYYPSQKSYAGYGAKGVFVCQGLRQHPQNLLDLIGPRPDKEPTLDRFPIHNGNYTCGKCDECQLNGLEKNIRWASRKQQSENRGDFTKSLTAFGKSLLASQWAKLVGMNCETIRGRVRKGWSVERALTTPDKKGNCYRPEPVSG